MLPAVPAVRPGRRVSLKEVPLSEIKDDLSRYLREAETLCVPKTTSELMT
jgi:hypothetical protein